MPPLNRRTFVKGMLLPVAVGALAGNAHPAPADDEPAGAPPNLIDVNVHLFDWPFRQLKYAQTGALLAKLRKHRIVQAWAGSFEGLLHKNLDGVNARLAHECQANGENMLVPFGAINPALPDWDEDLRRCHEKYKMPGIQLYPSYHNYTLQHPEMARLLDLAAQRGLLVQLAVRMEDPRVHLPVTLTPAVDVTPLPELLAKARGVRLQLLNAFNGTDPLRGRVGQRLIEETGVTFDVSHIEGQGGVRRLIDGDRDASRPPVPVERLLFGSHAPYFPCESSLFKLFESPLSRSELEPLMHRNAAALLKV
jgi:predicted TIM-barrel fold metal-dependent hydrolase